MAGQEGLEPPASGFGDRRSTNWSYWPVYYSALPRFLMHRMFIAERTIFLKLNSLRMLSLVLIRIIIPSLAFGASQYNSISWHNILSNSFYYSIISEMTPAPTVRPPSRIANRNSFSRAIGVINSASIATLSPGITISTFSGRFTTPVTSVVRK